MDGIPLNSCRPLTLTKVKSTSGLQARKEEILHYGRKRLSLLFLQLSQKLHFTNTQSRLSVIEIMHIEGVKNLVEKEVSNILSKPSNPPVFGQDLLQVVKISSFEKAPRMPRSLST